jgi:hypothetical protein
MPGRESYDYNPSRMLVFSVDLPGIRRVTRASQAKPCLALWLNLDPCTVVESGDEGVS